MVEQFEYIKVIKAESLEELNKLLKKEMNVCLPGRVALHGQLVRTSITYWRIEYEQAIVQYINYSG